MYDMRGCIQQLLLLILELYVVTCGVRREQSRIKTVKEFALVVLSFCMFH